MERRKCRFESNHTKAVKLKEGKRENDIDKNMVNVNEKVLNS